VAFKFLACGTAANIPVNPGRDRQKESNEALWGVSDKLNLKKKKNANFWKNKWRDQLNS
jgi:hypothetical protein